MSHIVEILYGIVPNSVNSLLLPVSTGQRLNTEPSRIVTSGVTKIRACVEIMGNTPDHASEGEDMIQTTNRKGSESYSGKIKRGSLVQLQQGALQKKLAVRRVFLLTFKKYIGTMPMSPLFFPSAGAIRWKR